MGWGLQVEFCYANVCVKELMVLRVFFHSSNRYWLFQIMYLDDAAFS